MASRQAEREQRRQQRVAAEQAAARAAARRRRTLIAGGVAAVVAAIVVAVVLVTSGGGGGAKASGGAGVALGPAFDDIAKLPGAQAKPPPWDNGASSLAPRLKAIGLPQLGAEGTVVHIHQHLDLFVSGRQVTVPEGIGIDPAGKFLTILHTHDPSGIIHVESPQAATFSLGQFFAVWGVPLSRRCIGSLCAGSGKVLQTWVNGKRLNADPTRIELAAHQEIVIAYGTPAQMPKSPPSEYKFPAGL